MRKILYHRTDARAHTDILWTSFCYATVIMSSAIISSRTRLAKSAMELFISNAANKVVTLDKITRVTRASLIDGRCKTRSYSAGPLSLNRRRFTAARSGINAKASENVPSRRPCLAAQREIRLIINKAASCRALNASALDMRRCNHRADSIAIQYMLALRIDHSNEQDTCDMVLTACNRQ